MPTPVASPSLPVHGPTQSDQAGAQRLLPGLISFAFIISILLIRVRRRRVFTGGKSLVRKREDKQRSQDTPQFSSNTPIANSPCFSEYAIASAISLQPPFVPSEAVRRTL